MMARPRRRELVLWGICLVEAILLAGVLLLDWWGIRPWHGPIDYHRFGTWSEAISGIATTAAVVVAMAGLAWQRLTQHAMEAAQLIESETAVFHWLTSKEVHDEGAQQLIGRLWDLRVQNSTSAPIYRWKVSFSSSGGHLCNWQKRPLLPGENVLNVPFLDNVEPSQAPEPVLVFQGRSSGCWMRTAQGVLQSVTLAHCVCEHSPSPQ